jgi:hypothetical protein
MMIILKTPYGAAGNWSRHACCYSYLSRKMHDSVNLLRLQHKADKIHRLNIALDKLHKTAGSRPGSSTVLQNVN